MAEDRKALLRRKAAHSALQGTPQSEDVRNRIQDVLALSGAVLTSGASYDQLMRTIREYADETHQPLERVLRDSAQLEGIIAGTRVRHGPDRSIDLRRKEEIRVRGRRRAIANAVMEQGGKSATLSLQELEDIRDAVLVGNINELPSEVRTRLRGLSKQIESAQERARGRIKDVVLYSPGGESPRLAKFAGEYGQLLGSGRGSSQQIMENWKRNVDPEFLKKLSFVHWTTSPESLATGRGIPAVDGSLSAGIYFRGDPTGHGFVSNKFASAPFGLVLEGDITWTGNRDVYSYGGEVDRASMDYVRDPILDEATFETQATRVERRMIDTIEWKRSKTRRRPGNVEDYPFSFTPNINEALIKKPRVVGIVVDPATFDILSLQNLYTEDHANYNLTRAMVFAEEMGIPIYDVAGQPLPEIFQPESVNPAEIKRVAQNFPSAAELTGGKGYARTAGGKSLFQALSNLESHGFPEDLVPLPDIPSMQEMRAARRELETPNHGGKKRAQLRTEMRKRLWQESQLHSGSTPHVSHKTLGGHVTHLSKPLSTPEEFAEAWRFERLKKDFKESFFGRGVVDSYSSSAPENPLFSDPSLTEGLHPSSSAEEIFEALIKKPEKATLLETLTLMEQVGEDGLKLLDDWTKLKAVQGEEITPLEMQSKLKEIDNYLMEEARELGKEDAYRFMVGEDEAKTLSQEEVQGEEEAAKRRADRKASRPSLDDLLQEEGIPRESFIDFSELPENQGKPTRSVIEAYKIAGELPESAGVPEGRSPKAYPLKGLSPEEPTLRPNYTKQEMAHPAFDPQETHPPEVSPDQKAFAAQDPEARLSVVEGSSPEYKPQLSVEKARAALADPAQQDDFIHWLATRDPEARIPDEYADLTPTPVEAEWRGGAAKANGGMQDLVQRFRRGEINSDEFQKILRSRMGAGPQDMVVFRGVPSEGLNLGSWSGADEARFLELIALPEHTPQTRAEGQRLWEKKRTAGGQFFSDRPEVALHYAKDTGSVHAMKLSPEEALKWSKGTQTTPGGVSSNFQIPNEAIQTSQAGGGGFLEIEEEVAKVLEDIASGKVETTPEARKALLADKAVKAKWGPRIVKGLTVLGDVALAADLGYQLGKHGPSGIMDVGAHTVEGAALMAELPKMAADRFVPGYGEKGVHLGTEMLAGAGRAVKGTMDPFHRHRDRQERVKKLEGLQAEYERAGLDTMAARRQAAADIAAGGVAFYQTPQIADRLRWDPERARRELRQERRPPTDPSRLAQWGLKEDAENQRDAAWHEELGLDDIDLGIEEEPEQPPMTTDPREMARWAAKRALEK